jgi:hypothetical protein
MTQRITSKHLHAKVDTLNRMMGKPTEPYQAERDEDGRLVANAGTYSLSGAYGGYDLVRMCEGGGESSIFSCGHVKASVLADLISAYMRGIQDARAV